MLALDLWRQRRCRHCGGDLEETTAEENDGTPGRSGYRPLLPVRCHRCTALAASEEQYNKNSPHPRALIHRVELQPPRRRPPS